MITDDETAKIAKLGRLALSPEEVQRFAKDLSEILDYAHQLNELDLQGVDPLSHVQAATNVFRADEIETPLSVDEGLMNAPKREGRFIQVPLIIE